MTGVSAASLGALLPALAVAAERAAPTPARIYAALQGETVLENSHVLVEKIVIPPGQSTGRHSHPGDQLLVFIKGGVLKSADTGRATLWRDGRVVWQAASERGDPGSTNVGTEPIVMIWVTVKGIAAAAGSSRVQSASHYLNYPNIPGEDLLENERVIVQRFTVNPGQWEGVHAHHPNMLYIHVRGGQWAARSHQEPEHPYPEPDPDGEVGWMPTIDLSAGHESGNIGKTPIDLIWVTLKERAGG
jgi:quercetin dioxygenase-like cupin family protein